MKNLMGSKRRRAQVATGAAVSASCNRSRSGPFDAPIELLESRRYLAATLAGVRQVVLPKSYLPAEVVVSTNKASKNRDSTGDYEGSTTPSGITPTVMRSAYGLTQVEYTGGIPGDGRGQTIAIVDSYDYSSALSDLNAFSSYYSLPALINNTSTSSINNSNGPTFTKVSQTGSTTALPGNDPAGPFSSTNSGSWETEESLDIEWAHVMAPQANIVLVEASTSSFSDRLSGVGWARAQPSVVAVSMSWGVNEEGTDAAGGTYGDGKYDSNFTSPVNHLGGSASAGGTDIAGGVTFLASTGDFGIYSNNNPAIQVHYPASSRFVVAVGGTRLTVSGNNYSSETAWGNGTNSYINGPGGGGGGGGISQSEDQPAGQSGFATKFSTTKRTYPDLALDADPASGVPIYDSYDFDDPHDTTYTPWGFSGGTSLACPMMAGMVAVADQGRALKGLGSLDGINDVLPKIYSVAAADYHDITSGSNGYSPTYVASTGYDLETGRGTPIATSWIRDVGGVTLAANVSGRTFLDNNGNGIYDAGDSVEPNIQVYYDANNNGQKDSSEFYTTSDSNGLYGLYGVPANTADSIRSTSQPNLAVLLQGASVNVTPGITGTADLAFEATSFTDAGNNDTWLVQAFVLNVHHYQVFENGVIKSTLPDVANYGLQFTFTGANDNLTIDNRNATIATQNSSYLTGTAGQNDSLKIIGSDDNDLTSVNGAAVFFGRLTSGGSETFYINNISNITVDPLSGTDSLEIDYGTVHIPAQAAGGGFLRRVFSSLDIEANAKLVLDSAAASTDRTDVVMNSASGLTINSTGQLDLGSNDMIIKGAGSVAAADTLLKTGYNGAAWNGVGIASAAAAANPKKNTAIGAILNGSLYTTFDGTAVAANDVLLKYTYYGDADLNGKVNAADYHQIDSGYQQQTGTNFIDSWLTGDFNYDGKINSNDYHLIDTAFQTQT